MKMAELERFAGEPELAARWTRLAAALKRPLKQHFFDPGKGLYADDLAHGSFSRHAQCLALLSGVLGRAEAARLFHTLLATREELARPSIFFSHYLFETYARFGRTDLLLQDLAPWHHLPAQGLFTTPECFVDSPRSDCHAWGAHPLYHFYASLLGIRPAGLGGGLVIAPAPGGLERLSGSLPYGGRHGQDGVCQGRVTASASAWSCRRASPASCATAAGTRRCPRAGRNFPSPQTLFMRPDRCVL